MRVTPAEGRRGLVARQAPGATLLETALVCALLLAGLALGAAALSPIMVQRGSLNAVPIAALWGAARLEVSGGSPRRALVVEAMMAVAVTTLAWGLLLVASLTEASFGDRATLARVDTYIAVYAVSAFVYGSGRFGLHVWLFWDRLRRRRMVWSLTHALLMAALVAASPIVVLGIASYALELARDVEAGSGGLASLLASAVIWGAPLAGAALAVGIAGLLALLPVLALPAYVVARRTTRRLEALARTARDLRGGSLSARVEVRGEDEVAQLQRDFNAMAEDLQRAMDDLAAERDRVAGLLEARRDLVAGVSHELRTPVATLRAHLESALDGGEPRWDGAAAPPAARGELELMLGEVVRLQGLIEDLFALSRAEVGRLTLRKEPVALGDVAERVVGAMAPVAWSRGRVRLLAEGDDDVRAVADVMRVEQVLVNLLHNALRHTPPGGMVMVRARSEPSRAVLEVCDTGEGIAPEDLPHVWERYYRGERTAFVRRGASDDDGGSGLGLALVKQLAEAMGGDAVVDSVPGEGSRFRVFLPPA